MHGETAAKGDVVGLAQHRGQHGLGGSGGHALVAAWPIDDIGTDADAADVVVQPVDPGAAFVGLLVDAVERPRPERRLVADGAGRVFILDAIDRRAAGVGEMANAQRAGGFQEIHRAHHVHLGAQDGIGFAHGHLQRRQMDDVGGGGLAQRAFHLPGICDVAADEAHLADLGGGHDQLHALGPVREVEDRDGHALAHQAAHHPGADAAQGAGDKEVLLFHLFHLYPMI